MQLDFFALSEQQIRPVTSQRLLVKGLCGIKTKQVTGPFILKAIASGVEAIARKLKAIATWLEAIASRVEAIASRVEAIATTQ